MKNDWYHRAPCHRCKVCGGNGCMVRNPGETEPEMHVCAGGCDGTPWEEA